MDPALFITTTAPKIGAPLYSNMEKDVNKSSRKLQQLIQYLALVMNCVREGNRNQGSRKRNQKPMFRDIHFPDIEYINFCNTLFCRKESQQEVIILRILLTLTSAY